MRTCKKCGEAKPLTEYNKHKRGPGGLRSACRECQNQQLRSWKKDTSYQGNEWAAANPEIALERRLGRQYGITLAEYQQIIADQDGRCAICKQPPGNRALHIDHDHNCCPGNTSCGKCVRALLCHSCNVGLGHFRDSIELLSAAQNYLNNFKEGSGT